MKDTQEIIKGLSRMPGNKRLPKGFSNAMDQVARPFLEISEEEYEYILKLTTRPATDFVIFRGLVCTFGGSEGHRLLMPLRQDLQEKYLP